MDEPIRILLVAQAGYKAYLNRLQGPGREVRHASLAAAWSTLNMIDVAPTSKVDLVVTDFGERPNAVGGQLTRRLRQHDRAARLPVLGVATDDRDSDFVHAVRAGVTDWLAMPFTPEEATAKIERLLRAGVGTMSELYGTEDLGALRRLSNPAAVTDDDASLAERMAAAERGAREESAQRVQGMLDLLPDEDAAPFTGRELSFEERIELEEVYDRARAERRLKEIVTTYDFRHPARVSRDQLLALESVHDEYARRLSTVLSGMQRAIVDVDIAFVDQTTYGEFIASLSNPSVTYQFQVGGLGPSNVVLDVAMPVAFSLIDRAHGGRGSGAGAQPRLVTQIEIAVVNGFAKRALEALEEVWHPVLGEVEVRNAELETNPEFIEATARHELVILIAFEVNAGDVNALVSLCYPFFTLEPALPHLGGPTVGHGRRHRHRRDPRPENRLRLGGMRLPAVVELGRTRLPAGDARRLRAGDVIRLDSRCDGPLCVFVGGKPKLLGWPQEADDGHVGVRVAGRVPPAYEAKLGLVDARLTP